MHVLLFGLGSSDDAVTGAQTCALRVVTLHPALLCTRVHSMGHRARAVRTREINVYTHWSG